MTSKVVFPCMGQNLYNFYAGIICRQALVKITFVDGFSLVHSYKDFDWRTHDPYPLAIFNAGYFDLDGRNSENKILKNLISLEIVNNWLGE